MYYAVTLLLPQLSASRDSVDQGVTAAWPLRCRWAALRWASDLDVRVMGKRSTSPSILRIRSVLPAASSPKPCSYFSLIDHRSCQYEGVVVDGEVAHSG